MISQPKSLVAPSDHADAEVFRSRYVPDYLKADAATFRRFKNPIDPKFVSAWNGAGEKYSGNIWPSHWTQVEQQRMSKYYDAMPEEFYTLSGLTVVSPTNCFHWIDRMAKHGYKTFHFSECMSGSGRLSLGCLMGGMWISFPVDFRYGWDLRT